MLGLNIESALVPFINIASMVLLYPFLTVMKRIECQSSLATHSMLREKYSGIIHGLRLINKEEGKKALFKGISSWGFGMVIV